MPLWYQSSNMIWEHRPAGLCREGRSLFDSVGRARNGSLEGDVSKQAGFSENFGAVGYRKTGDIALPSFLAFVNSVDELVGTILSRINIANTNKLAEAVESWGRGASGGAPLLDDPRRQKAWDLPIVKRNWDYICYVRWIRCLDYWPLYRKRAGAWLNALPASSLGTQLDLGEL